MQIASGLPIRNGNQHAFAIVDTALAVLEMCQSKSFFGEAYGSLEIRIGVHSGG